MNKIGLKDLDDIALGATFLGTGGSSGAASGSFDGV